MEKVMVKELDKSTIELMYIVNQVRVTEMAKIFGRDTKDVLYTMFSLGVKPVTRQGERTTVQFELDQSVQGVGSASNEVIRKLYNDGFSDYRIAKTCGVTEDLVRGRRKSMGLATVDRPDHKMARESAIPLLPYVKGQTGMSPSQSADALGRLAAITAKNGAAPSRTTWDNAVADTLYPSHAVEHYFGSWVQFVKSAGLSPARGNTTPRENMESYIKACQEKGKVLSSYEYGEAMGGAGPGGAGNKYEQRYKRMLSDKNGTHRHLKSELSAVCLDREASEKFLTTHFGKAP